MSPEFVLALGSFTGLVVGWIFLPTRSLGERGALRFQTNELEEAIGEGEPPVPSR